MAIALFQRSRVQNFSVSISTDAILRLETWSCGIFVSEEDDSLSKLDGSLIPRGANFSPILLNYKEETMPTKKSINHFLEGGIFLIEASLGRSGGWKALTTTLQTIPSVKLLCLNYFASWTYISKLSMRYLTSGF